MRLADASDVPGIYAYYIQSHGAPLCIANLTQPLTANTRAELLDLAVWTELYACTNSVTLIDKTQGIRNSLRCRAEYSRVVIALSPCARPYLVGIYMTRNRAPTPPTDTMLRQAVPHRCFLRSLRLCKKRLLDHIIQLKQFIKVE